MRADERVVRVFVSSTFRDMAAERDVLVRHVFPRLRTLCAERGVAFTEIDLRWGLTDEEVAEGQVLPICLAEIDRCKPFFIGLLGERYGWVPDRYPDGLTDRESWLLAHEGATSVTELEILHGVLNDPEMEHKAFFYLRDPAYIGSEEFERDTAAMAWDRSAYVEDPADPTSAGRQAKLAALKQRLRVSGFPVREPVSGPTELGHLVLEDLTAAIDAVFPAHEAPDPLDAERLLHEHFARARSQVYIGRSAYLDRLDDHADGTDGTGALVVLGESGSGKSSLVATWSASYRARHPDAAVIADHTGISQKSAELGPLLDRLNHELAQVAGEPTDPGDEEPIPRFARLLGAAATTRRVVLVLDALDQLDADAAELRWLPPVVPSRVRLVLSALPGTALDELTRRGWADEPLKVRPLDHDERRRLVETYLGASAKQLSPAQTDQLVNLPQASSPLYLRLLLEELRVWGRHETVGSRLDRLCRAATTAQLLELILTRLESDLEAQRPGLVGDALRLIWASRSGLTEAELAEVLGDDDGRLPGAYWSPLRVMAAQMLSDRDGRFTLAHAHVRRAVEDRYLADADAHTAAHRALAEHFVRKGPEPRSIEEAPWQLAQLEDWTALATLLADPAWFVRLVNHDRVELRRWWAIVHRSSDERAATHYVVPEGLDAETTIGHTLLAADLLDGIGEVLAAVELLVALEETGVLTDEVDLLEWGRRLLEALNSLGFYEQVIEQLPAFDDLARSVDDDNYRWVLLELLADAYANTHRIDEALAARREAQALAEAAGNPAWVMMSLRSLASHHEFERDDVATAIDLTEQCRAMALELGDEAAEADALVNLVRLHDQLDPRPETLALLDEAAGLARSVGSPDLEGRIRYAEIGALERREQWEEALGRAVADEQERWALGDLGGVLRALGSQGRCLQRLDQPDSALAVMRRAVAVCDDARLTDERLHYGLGLARAAKAAGELDEAFEAIAALRAMLESLGWDRPDLAADIADLEGDLHEAAGDGDAALACWQAAIAGYQSVEDSHSAVLTYWSGIFLLAELGRADEAGDWLRAQEPLLRELDDEAGLAENLDLQRSLLGEEPAPTVPDPAGWRPVAEVAGAGDRFALAAAGNVAVFVDRSSDGLDRVVALDVRTGAARWAWEAALGNWGPLVTPDGALVAVAGRSGAAVEVLATADGTSRSRLHVDRELAAVPDGEPGTFSVDAKHLLVVGRDLVAVWKVRKGKRPVGVLDLAGRDVVAAAFTQPWSTIRLALLDREQHLEAVKLLSKAREPVDLGGARPLAVRFPTGTEEPLGIHPDSLWWRGSTAPLIEPVGAELAARAVVVPGDRPRRPTDGRYGFAVVGTNVMAIGDDGLTVVAGPEPPPGQLVATTLDLEAGELVAVTVLEDSRVVWRRPLALP